VFGRRRPPRDLEPLLRQYLELQVRELQDRAEAARAARHRDEIRAEVGRMVLFLVLLAAYSLVLGTASRVLVISTLVDPDAIAHAVQTVATGGSEAIAAVPDALQGVLISAITAVALLMFHGTSTSLRSDLGGLLFVGAAILSLIGISAAAFTGIFGLLVALPGFVAVALMVGQLCWMLVRLHGEPAGARPHENGSPARWSSRQPALWSRRLSPAGRPPVIVAFVALPALCILAVTGGVLANGGLLYTPAFASRFVALAWCLWAIVVTPAAARIPLWASLGWGWLIATLLSAYPVSFLFALAVAVLVYADALWLVLGSGRTRAP
jgi:hypothetical protein